MTENRAVRTLGLKSMMKKIVAMIVVFILSIPTCTIFAATQNNTKDILSDMGQYTITNYTASDIVSWAKNNGFNIEVNKNSNTQDRIISVYIPDPLNAPSLEDNLYKYAKEGAAQGAKEGAKEGAKNGFVSAAEQASEQAAAEGKGLLGQFGAGLKAGLKGAATGAAKGAATGAAKGAATGALEGGTKGYTEYGYDESNSSVVIQCDYCCDYNTMQCYTALVYLPIEGRGSGSEMYDAMRNVSQTKSQWKSPNSGYSVFYYKYGDAYMIGPNLNKKDAGSNYLLYVFPNREESKNYIRYTLDNILNYQ